MSLTNSCILPVISFFVFQSPILDFLIMSIYMLLPLSGYLHSWDVFTQYQKSRQVCAIILMRNITKVRSKMLQGVRHCQVVNAPICVSIENQQVYMCMQRISLDLFPSTISYLRRYKSIIVPPQFSFEYLPSAYVKIIYHVILKPCIWVAEWLHHTT